MKRLLCFIMAIIIILSFGCNKKGISKIMITPLNEEKQELTVPWNEMDFKAALKSYNIKADLSNIVNTSDIPTMDLMDKYVLSRYSFIIKKPSDYFEQPFNVYEKNSEEGIPNFITTDSMLHVYHLLCDYVIRGMEREKLINELKQFTQASFKKSMEIYNGITEPNAKKAALMNIAYFGIAMRLMEFDLPGGIPLEANRIIDNDTKKVKSRWSSGSSEIFPYYIDYKRYIARGHYLRETDFRNYFLTMMWYGSTPMFFEMHDAKSGKLQRMDEQIIMSVMMASQVLGEEELKKLWDDMYRVTAAYAGNTEEITLYDLSDIIKVVYGDKIDFNKVWNENKIKMVYELAKQRYNLHAGQTLSGRISSSNKENKIQANFRLMGQMYSLDSDIYNNLTVVNDTSTGQSRLFPKGLDIPAAFGNNNAYSILTNGMNEDKAWMKYPENMQRLMTILSGTKGDNPSEYSINNSLLWVLKGYNSFAGSGYPSFMQNSNWEDKRLITFMGALSDTRHPTYLVSKQGSVKITGDIKTLQAEIPGYVEPDVALYNRLGYMGKYIKELLSANNFYNSSLYSAVDNFIETVEFLKEVSAKELNSMALTSEEESRLRKYGEELKALTLNMVEGKGSLKQWDQIPKVDRSMASVSDSYFYENQVLETAIGSPDYIYVAVPYRDKLYIARGSIYSYYEFVQPISKRIEDADWQTKIKDNEEIEQQAWIKRIRAN